ncbi:serine/threonine protein kinase [Planctomyces sp. SH-PL62]|uniref:serine/threonine protein kinase n=1 Tax=Planctomyces sp. SH-PL62 TaxID=1636152 RepID=UPI00078EE93D|nr:serine/threonine-protein kinase [Planctomyces sp. SH-PL62]AMV39140.1 Serine/threonine-protein kinase PknB [Planctomyces sp. SH-PL62]
MLDPKTSQFWKAALQSGLLDEEALEKCGEAIPVEKRDAVEHLDRRLGRQAVQLGYLTLWQAQQLLAGRVTGFRVDRYILQNLIGQGGMGRVYLAKDTRLARQVALKILSPERMNNPRAIARFQREAKVGAQLQHENLVRLYDFGESQGRHFLVMEYIEGRSLGFFIATEGRIPPALAARFGRQVALGLDHAHRKGLIHRDVNPYNIIVTQEGVAKLADMGLAIDLADEGQVTRDGATVGTFDYVAPEQARHSHAAGIRSDIYSLGCSLYHMISGQVPFPYPSLTEKLFAHQSQEAESLASIAPDTPPGLVEIVRKMMRKLPDERFQEPLEVAMALRQFAEKTSGEREPVLAGGLMTEAETAERPDAAQPDMAMSSTSGGERGLEPSGEFSLRVDIGPEPSLTESTRSPRAWFGGSGTPPASSGGSSTKVQSDSASNSSGWSFAEAASSNRRRWLKAGGLLIAIGLIVGGVEYLRRRPVSQIDADSAREGSASTGGKASPTGRGRTGIEWGKSSIAVLGIDGKAQTAPELLRAMESALGGKGIVVFKGGEPIEFKVDGGFSLTGRGTLQLQGEEGAQTVLKIDLNGKKPFLSLGSSVNLVLKDLTIEVRRTSEAGKQDAPPPLILAAGKAEIERCSFRTAPAVGYSGSCAVQAVGGALTISHCWFEGFQTGVEVRALAGASHVIRQSMFVPGGTPTEAIKAGRPVRTGWAGKVQFEGGGARGGARSIRLEHCTVVGEGFLRLVGFSDLSKLVTEVVSCAFKGDRLLDWQPTPAEAPPSRDALIWKGIENQYDVAGDSWISGPESAPSVTGLDDWSARFAETQPIRSAVQFTMESVTPDGRLTPRAYSLVRPASTAPGANPAEVGPRLRN